MFESVSTRGIFWASRAHNSKVTGQIWPEFELFRDFMPVLVTCKIDEDPIGHKGAIMSTTIFSGAQGRVAPKLMVGSGQNSNSSEILCMSGYLQV